MAGELKGDSVIIADQAEGSRLYNRGSYGYPISRGGLELDLVEATYLLECNRLEVNGPYGPMDFESMFRYASGCYPEFDIRYIVYRDIRQRGFIVKNETGGGDMAVYPRGMIPSRSPPQFMLMPVSEQSKAHLEELAADASHRKCARVYGVVDEEGDLTYYQMSFADMAAGVLRRPIGPVDGTFVRDRVFVFDQQGSEDLRANGFYGKTISGVLQLSLMEACHLSEEGVLKVQTHSREPVSLDDLKHQAEKSQESFRMRYSVYRDLRAKGLTVKTGFKYGTHFRVYEGSPDDSHARYLVHALPASEALSWPEISRIVRLSGGVKKEILLALMGKKVDYLTFKWFRP